MKIIIPILSICFTSAPTTFAQEKAEEQPKPLAVKPAPLAFIPEKVTDTVGKGKAWIIDDKFAAKHKAEYTGYPPFMVTLMPVTEGKVFYLTRPEVPEIFKVTRATADKKFAESIRFTTMTMPTNLPKEVRLAKSIALMEKQVAPHFAKAHKSITIAKRYTTKVGIYDAAVVLGKLTMEDDSVQFMKIVTILRSNNPEGYIAIMFLDPTAGKKEDLKQRLDNGYVQQVLHSFRFLKKKAPAVEQKDIPKTE